ncbi:ABC transporter [Kitasatospora sp. RB6PN24]|uniref:ABC transporter n=1 Tax=Kitasatospora humi TaxID=2893891 RepID=UPI001E55B03B|nr:ABC transporter [Kitasatospora humi]MCC9306825.1 ABC transporter [Kitasatospora humi]
MTALTRYQVELLLRSQRWLPPFLGYALLLAVGVQTGSPLLDSLGVNAALLVPVTAWYARSTLADPPPASGRGYPHAARAVLVAARGAARVQLAALLAALLAGLLLAVLGTAAVWALSGPTAIPQPPAGGTPTPGHQVSVPGALLAGLLAAVTCVLTGLAVGALCHRPVLLRAGYGMLGALGLSVLVLVMPGSPANQAVRALVTGSRLARVELPVLALVTAAVPAALVGAGSAWLAGRRTE